MGIDLGEPADGRHHAREVVADETGHAVVYDLVDRAVAQGDHGRSGRHGFDHHKAERLRPQDREQKAGGPGEQLALAALGDLVFEDDLVAVDLRRDAFLEVVAIPVLHDAGHDEASSGGARDLDGEMEALVFADASEGQQVVVFCGLDGQPSTGRALWTVPAQFMAGGPSER